MTRERENLKKLIALGYGIAGHWGNSKKAYILESKEEMSFSVNGEEYYGRKYTVFNRETGNSVYMSHSYSDCIPILKAICTE